MSKYQSINFAVVGLGHIGKRHAQIIMDHPDANLIAVCDTEKQIKTGFNHPVPYYASIEEMLLNTPNIDVVNICTPNGLHTEQALKVLEARKHVVIEKPIALSKADAEKVIFKSLNVSKKVFAVMQNRYSPPAIWLKELITNNTLGNIYLVQLNCFWNRDDRYYTPNNWHGTKKLDGGTLYTQFSHFIDTLYWLFGDITDINSKFEDFCHSHSTEFEDSGLITFKFKNGGIGSIAFSTAVWDKNMESSLSIIAQHGSLKIAGQYMNEVTHCHIKNYTMPQLKESNPPNDYGAYKGSAANHNYVINNVIETLHDKTSITTNALEGMKVVEIIENIYNNKK